jgi:serine/threonine protein kinase
MLSSARIDHINVRTVFGVGYFDVAAFVAEGHGSGTNLSTLVARLGASQRRLSTADAAHLVLGVCRGLVASHRRGVFHGGLVPHHIYLSAEGYAQIGDFEVGVSRPPATEQDDRSSARRLLELLASLTGEETFAAVRLPDRLQEAPEELGRWLAPKPCASLATTLESLFGWQADREPLFDHLCYPSLFPRPIHDAATPTELPLAPVFIADAPMTA